VNTTAPASGGSGASASAGSRTARLFYAVLAATAAVKLLAAAFVPITGDEAYFFLWGRHLDYGYYDHGPMVGWWLAPLLAIGDAPAWLRLPAVLVPLGIGVWLRHALRPFGAERADLAACLFLLSPVNLANFLITTDTPLLAFAVLAGIVAVAADRRDSLPLWALAGFLLGLGFLSKYLGVLLGVAWAVWVLFFKRPARWGALFAILAGATPPVALNIAWNHHHGWTNVLFNVMTRNGDAGVKAHSPLLYLLLWAVLLGPALVPLIAAGLRHHGLRDGWRQLEAAAGRGPLLMAAVPTVVLGFVSFFQEVGAHWLVAFVPWACLAVAAAVPPDRLRRALKPALVYGGLQAALIAVACLAPSSWIAGTRQHSSVVIGMHADEIAGALAGYLDDYVLASDSYARAALLAYHTRREVPVVGFGSHHGRQDDLLTDFRDFEGGNLMFFSNRPGRLELAREWFDQFEVRSFEVRGATFQLFLGRGFRYENYRRTVLAEVARRYYQAPRWLTRLSPPADFVERYGY
jgi:4-amino-4-deoxy-L-arabinose transferase-like glycosyltransferase